jgi:hypothetical protein
MSGEMKVSRWRTPLVVGGLVVLAAAIAVGVGALIAHDQAARPMPAAFSSPSASPSAIQSSDSHGQKACELNEDARSRDALGEDALLLRILNEAKQSTNLDIRFAAQMLFDRQALANAELKRGGDDLEMILGGRTASLKMSTDCVKAGLIRY